MASDNPSLTVANIITDVEARLVSPNLNSSVYFPWVSSAAQRIYFALVALGQEAKERYFATSDTISLTQSTLEHSITGSIPDFGSFISVDVLYGASGDIRNRARKLRTPAGWPNLNNVSTSYRGKDVPVYYQSGDNIGIIPVPPESGATAYVRYVQRLPQYTDEDDVIAIPYRFTWPIADYVQAKALQRVNEDYSTSRQIESDFAVNLDQIVDAASQELNENDGTHGVEANINSGLWDDPLGSL